MKEKTEIKLMQIIHEQKRKWGEYHEQKQNWLENIQQDLTCPDCGEKMIKDFLKCESYCPQCGLVYDSTEYKAGMKWKHGGL